MADEDLLFLRQRGTLCFWGHGLELIRGSGLPQEVVMAVKERIFIHIAVADLRKILLVARAD